MDMIAVVENISNLQAARNDIKQAIGYLDNAMLITGEYTDTLATNEIASLRIVLSHAVLEPLETKLARLESIKDLIKNFGEEDDNF